MKSIQPISCHDSAREPTLPEAYARTMPHAPTSDDELAALFREFGNSVGGRVPLYSDLCQIIADEPRADIRELLNNAPPTQRRPVLLLAAIHRLALEHQHSNLAMAYPSVTGESRPRGHNMSGLAQDLKDFCEDLRDDLIAIVSTRHTQTNDISRSAILRLALAHEPVIKRSSLIDIGCSAGLNLHLDSYRTTYTAETGSWNAEAGDPEAPSLTCSVRDETAPSVDIGGFDRRIGFDPQPLDVNTDDAIWLLACVWPDQLDRIARLRSAIQWMKLNPVDLRVGDALGALNEVEVMDDTHLTIINSWVLSYLSDEDQRSYRQRMEALGQTRDLTWVYLEQPSTTQALQHPVSLASDATRSELTAVTRIDWLNGNAKVFHLGTMHPHGYWFHPS